MADFKKPLEKSGALEGSVLENVPGDEGGETIFGIARNIDTAWPGWAVVDELRKDAANFPANVNNNGLLSSLAKDWLKAKYWDKIAGDDISSQAVAQRLYLSGLLNGIPRMIGALQVLMNALNWKKPGVIIFDDLKPTGVMDVSTVHALEILLANGDEVHILHMLYAAQESRFVSLASGKFSSRKFIRGWDNRAQDE